MLTPTEAVLDADDFETWSEDRDDTGRLRTCVLRTDATSDPFRVQTEPLDLDP